MDTKNTHFFEMMLFVIVLSIAFEYLNDLNPTLLKNILTNQHQQIGQPSDHLCHSPAKGKQNDNELWTYSLRH